MSNSNTNERKQAIANLAKVWPNAKLGKVSNENLAWLMEVVGCFAKGKRSMADTMQRYRNQPDHYQTTTSYTGRKSLSIGDEVAQFLDGMSPAEVLEAAERILGLEQHELAFKYAHLNAGQQRMNGGNRLRAAVKRGDIATTDLH